MKYKISGVAIPQDKRKAINEKILHIIENNLQCGITASDIFNSYTGVGGLHDLEYKDYNSRYEYGEAKKEVEQGQFFTPSLICKFITDCIKPSKTDIIADLCFGMGNFYNSLPVEKNIYGCELDIKAYKVTKYLYPDANIQCEDIRYYNPDVKFDIVFGNPPFNLKWKIGYEEYLSQLYYCIKSSALLKPAGLLVLVMPNSFLADTFSDGGMIKEINNNFNFICQFDLPSDSFKNVGVENFETKVMFFQKKSEHLQEVEYTTDKITITDADTIYNRYIKPVQEQKEKIKNKLFFENLHKSDSEENREFAYKVKKLLYDIQVNPKVSSNYGKCYEYVNKFYTQKMPEGMKYEEWDKIKLTHNKVLAYLKRYLLKQNEVEQDKIALVKTSYGLKLKGYNSKNKTYLSKYDGHKEEQFYNMVQFGNYPFEDKTYFRLYLRKYAAYLNQSQPFKDMQEQPDIKKYLDNLVITDYETGEEIKLNNIQSLDTNKMLQKQYGFIQWEQGSGKSISSIAQFKYRFEHNNIRNVFIVSTAIAINNTWDVILTNYRENYIRINCMEDINNIQRGQIVLITLNMLSKYQRQIKKYIKKQSQKVMLILDESDNISSPTSKRTKAVLNCYRTVKYKNLDTGTMTRNNISESATQFELLYNNSVNMISECSEIYYMGKDSKSKNELYSEVELYGVGDKDNPCLCKDKNPYYLKPIPAYNKGYRLFSASHLPEKITVFGVGQKTQDIYNADILNNLIDKTIITRTQEEVTGRKLYEIIQETCSFNPAELDLYTTVIEKFHEMKYLFTSTGNLRKDRMLEILNQLLLMLKVCVIPCAFKEYQSKEIPSKIIKMLKMLYNFRDERVAIGCRHIKTVMIYANIIKQAFPDRPIFIITGDSVSLNERKKIVKRLQATTNGILISTQQSLSSSMNIGFVNKVILVELHWNNSSMSQYYFRFIRYNSTEWKQVYFLTYENSIESNLLSLILAKEKLNLFMKNQELDEEELNERFGIDFDLLDMLMRKERDKDGKTFIRWGKQNIV
jgi:trans-aconitate methyltransferase